MRAYRDHGGYGCEKHDPQGTCPAGRQILLQQNLLLRPRTWPALPTVLSKTRSQTCESEQESQPLYVGPSAFGGEAWPFGVGRAHSALPFVLVFVSAPPLRPAKEKTMQVAESPGSTPIRGGAVPGSWMAHRTPNFYRLCPPEKRCGFG